MRHAFARPEIRRLMVCEALLNVQFWFPVWFFFLRDRGFDLVAIVLADTLYRVVVVVAEVPLGVVADRVGRKRAYLALCALTVVTFVVALQVRSVPALVAAWLLWGVQWAALSGVGSAYLAALLVDGLGGDVRPAAAFGLVRATTSATAALTLVVAGPLYEADPRGPFAACGACALLALLLALRMPEAEPGAPRVAVQRRRLRWLREVSDSERTLVALGAVVLCVGWTTILLWQPLADEVGAGPSGAGLMYALWAAAGSVAGLIVGRSLPVRSGTLVLGGATVMAIGLVGTGLLPAGAIWCWIPLVGVGYWVAATLVEARIATAADPSRRATLVSAVSMVGGVGIAILRPPLGLVYAEVGLTSAFLVAGLLSAASLLVVVALLRRLRAPAHWL